MKIKKMNLLWNVEVEEYKAYLDTLMLVVFLCILLVLLRIVYLRRINIIKRQEIIKDYLIEKKKERVSC